MNLDDPNNIRDLKRLVKNTEEYADMLIATLKLAKDALYRVTDLEFDDEMARYNDAGKLTEHAQDTISQYHDMVEQCAAALTAILQVVGSAEPLSG